MVMPAIVTSADQTMPGSCDHCGGNEKAMTTAACAAFGTCVQGVISSVDGLTARGETVPYTYSTEHISGFQGAPDPFPPRSDILA